MKTKKITFEAFKKEVERLMKKRHGLDPNDYADETHLKQAYDYNEMPVEYVENHATKYDLDRIDINPFTGKEN